MTDNLVGDHLYCYTDYPEMWHVIENDVLLHKHVQTFHQEKEFGGNTLVQFEDFVEKHYKNLDCE